LGFVLDEAVDTIDVIWLGLADRDFPNLTSAIVNLGILISKTFRGPKAI